MRAWVDRKAYPPIIGYRCELRGHQILAAYSDLPLVVSADSTLEGSLGGMLGEFRAKLLAVDRRPYGGLPSRRFELRAADGMRATVRLVLSGRRLYQAAVYAPEGEKADFADAFVDSLVVEPAEQPSIRFCGQSLPADSIRVQCVFRGRVDLGPLARLSRLEHIDLTGNEVADLGPLAGLQFLMSLNLRRTGVRDLGPLASLPRLDWLDLGYTEVRDLRPIEKLTGLKVLRINHTRVDSLLPLAKLTRLKDLDISGTPVSDLRPLSGLVGLSYLWMSSTKVADLSPLVRMEDLKGLYIAQTAVEDLTPLEDLVKKGLVIER